MRFVTNGNEELEEVFFSFFFPKTKSDFNCFRQYSFRLKFQVTKMRCWRIMTLTKQPDEISAGSESRSALNNSRLELSFEYLMNNQDLQWITVVSSQAILMSICLQSMVEELLRMKHNIPIKKVN